MIPMRIFLRRACSPIIGVAWQHPMHLGIFVLIWHEFFKKHSSQPPLPYCHNIWLEKNNEDTCVRYSWLLRLLGRVKTKATHSLPAKTSRYTLHLLILRSLKTSSTFCWNSQIMNRNRKWWKEEINCGVPLWLSNYHDYFFGFFFYTHSSKYYLTAATLFQGRWLDEKSHIPGHTCPP